MPYVDGFLMVVPTAKLAAYRRLARAAGEVWQQHGALEYRECVGDDLSQKGPASFRRRSGAKRRESVVFSWIVYRSRSHRDRVMAKVMADPRLAAMMQRSPPFDPRRISYGGFRLLVDL